MAEVIKVDVVKIENLRKGRKFALAINDVDNVYVVEYVGKSGDNVTVKDGDGEFEFNLTEARLYKALPNAELTSRTALAEEAAKVPTMKAADANAKPDDAEKVVEEDKTKTKATDKVVDATDKTDKTDDTKKDGGDGKDSAPAAPSKREIAEKIVAAGLKAKKTRKEMIEQIMTEASMSKAGASTYYFNAKTKLVG